MIFFWGGAQSRPLHPTPLDTYSTLPLLTEILNTPLATVIRIMRFDRRVRGLDW